jgi:hypothetical protein
LSEEFGIRKEYRIQKTEDRGQMAEDRRLEVEKIRRSDQAGIDFRG